MEQNVYDENEVEEKEMTESDININEKILQLHKEYECGVDLEDGVINLIGVIKEDSVYEFIGSVRMIKKYRKLKAIKLKDPITVFIHSYGGDLYAGLAIIDYINSLDIKINTISRGVAYSTSALILISGTGIRMLGKMGFIMFHEIDSDMEGANISNLKSNAEHAKKLQDIIEFIITSKSNKDKEYWASKIIKDYFISAEEALEYKLIDKIV